MDEAASEKSSAEEQVKDLREQLQTFKESQAALAAQTVQLMSERAALRDELQSVLTRAQQANKLSESDDQILQFVEKLRTARAARVAAEAKATEMSALVAKGQGEIALLRNQLREAQAARHDAERATQQVLFEKQAAITSLLAEANDKNKLLDHLSSTVQTLAATAERLQLESSVQQAKLQAEIDSLQQEARSSALRAKDNQDAAESALRSERMMNKSLADELAALRSDSETLRAAGKQLEEQAAQSLQQRQVLEARISQLEETARAARLRDDARIAEAAKELEQCRELLKQSQDERQRENESAAVRVQELDRQLKQERDENSTLRTARADLEVMASELKSRLEAMRIEFENQASLQQKKFDQELHQAHEIASRLKEELDRTASERVAMERMLKELGAGREAEARQASDRHKHLESVAAERAQEIERLRAAMQEREALLADKDNKLVAALEAHAELSKQLHALTNDLRQLRSEAERTRRDLQRQKEEANVTLTSVKNAFTSEMNKAAEYHQRLQDTLAANQARLDDVSQALEQERGLSASREQGLREREAESAALKDNLRILEARLEDRERAFEEERSALTSEVAQLNEKLADVTLAREKAAVDLQLALSRVEKLNAAVQASESVLTKENAALTKQVETMSERLKALNDVWVDKAKLVAKLAKLTAKSGRVADTTDACDVKAVSEISEQEGERAEGERKERGVSEEAANGSIGNAAIGLASAQVVRLQEAIVEVAFIRHEHAKLSVQYAHSEPRKVLVVFELADTTQARGIAFMIDAEEHERALAPSLLKIHRDKAHYFLHRYFSRIQKKPERLLGSDSELNDIFVRLFNRQGVAILGLSNMEFQFPPGRVPLAFRSFGVNKSPEKAPESPSVQSERDSAPDSAQSIGEINHSALVAAKENKVSIDSEQPEPVLEPWSADSFEHSSALEEQPHLAGRLRAGIRKMLRNAKLH